MEQEEFESRLLDSPHLRQSLSDLFQSFEQAISLIATAVGRQLDGARFEEDLLRLQGQAAAESPNPARDHILNEVRLRLRISKQI